MISTFGAPEYYAPLEQSREGRVFVEDLRRNMEVALTAFDANLLTNTKVKIVTTRKGKGRICLTPLEEQPNPRPHFKYRVGQ